MTPHVSVVRIDTMRPTDPQTYRNLLYLLLGLPLGTIWFTMILTVVAVGVGLIPVALVWIPTSRWARGT